MSLSMFDASVTVLRHSLGQLAHLLEKAAADAASRKIAPEILVQARLAPDMLPLAAQVQMACDTAKFAVARLSGQKAPSFDDKETTFAQLAERIAATSDFIATVPAQAFEGSEERAVTVGSGERARSFTGQGYLLHFALPNFFFHVTTAYAILRHNGVPIGKSDYLGAA
ncbi:DUF1993 domain-containing protein [Xylophilus sp. GOD-11R]|uniref:DUF1993 domain-containing protein n=1 Tax=Xylophilus sp. GOD-11R TaxID=3089814 RepID=UPI00298D5F0B|nr:DUF1993 domain-containing protein [Xylophilus sp. GOD-11R]WPB59192.1 DUF1993 domain-containing protein [Xylophilus sp. GOD-11R]